MHSEQIYMNLTDKQQYDQRNDNSIQVDTNTHIFIIPYSDLNLEVYNEEYFKRLGINAEIKVVIHNQSGGNHSFESILKMEKNDNTITVPYKFFHYRFKFLFGDIFSDLNKNISKENVFEKTMNNISVYGKHIADTLMEKSKNMKPLSINEKDMNIEDNKVETQEQEQKQKPLNEKIDTADTLGISENQRKNDIIDKEKAKTKVSQNKWFNKMQKWVSEAFNITDDPTKNDGVISIKTDTTNHIKIILYGKKSNIDFSNYADIIQYVKIIYNLHIKQITIKEIETVKINGKICIIGNIVKEDEPIINVFKRGIFKDFPLKKIENTEAHKLLLF